jgi:septum formation protein
LTNANHPRLILASTSPRRISLMRQHGYTFEVLAPPDNEPSLPAESTSPQEYAEAVSLFKARSVATIAKGWILAGDTVVALGARIFGKPADRGDARRILQTLQATTQLVITGVTLLDTTTSNHLVRSESTSVVMKPMSNAVIESYLDTNAWVGKAGAYGIQDEGDGFIERIEGSFTNVVGLPMDLVASLLSEWGYRPPTVSE